MSNHIHIIVGGKGEDKIEEIVRDFKKITAVHICCAIESNQGENRKEWMLSLFRECPTIRVDCSWKRGKYDVNTM